MARRFLAAVLLAACLAMAGRPCQATGWLLRSRQPPPPQPAIQTRPVPYPYPYPTYDLGAEAFPWGWFGADYRPQRHSHRGYHGDRIHWSYRRGR